jgi:hypothetical protein
MGQSHPKQSNAGEGLLKRRCKSTSKPNYLMGQQVEAAHVMKSAPDSEAFGFNADD